MPTILVTVIVLDTPKVRSGDWQITVIGAVALSPSEVRSPNGASLGFFIGCLFCISAIDGISAILLDGEDHEAAIHGRASVCFSPRP
ncbi:MAG: hypothetical protein JSS59_10370 [Proteobacteria bacterium]|uniref:hypothetical protein n=1 Tax=Rudaea sp. TaxID=2136325 RepID=UPI003783BA9C|nr:hypothetical protein [Pseudomonadota bacterium]